MSYRLSAISFEPEQPFLVFNNLELVFSIVTIADTELRSSKIQTQCSVYLTINNTNTVTLHAANSM